METFNSGIFKYRHVTPKAIKQRIRLFFSSGGYDLQSYAAGLPLYEYSWV